MPMDFPDMSSLLSAAKVHKFREPVDGETETGFRFALAEHVQSIDVVEANEIRTGRGHDKWSEKDRLALVAHSFKPWPDAGVK